ncbi:hypothetical protein [Deinococcus marmoris]|uniref:hypothetical protein n=1 Tax=Deinococcus marmoris TaxID=249408 RepID=UPI0011153A1E|nr:hypothetical protein [Deinococcus marmoris]
MGQPIDGLTVFTVNKAMQAVAERGLKPATLASYDRALRGFCSWLVGVELLAKNPMQNKKRPKLRWQPKQIITGTEIQKLFAVAKIKPISDMSYIQSFIQSETAPEIDHIPRKIQNPNHNVTTMPAIQANRTIRKI